MPFKIKRQPLMSVAGALHVDEVARVKGRFVPKASNPVSWQRYVGGVGCNAARAAQSVYSQASVGTVNLHAAIGDDADGQALISRIENEGLMVQPQFITGNLTGRYSAVMSESGELELGLADVQLAEQLHPRTIIKAWIEAPAHTVLLDANLSTDCISSLIEYAGAANNFIAAMAVSPHKVVRLAHFAHHIDLLFCNRLEAYALAEFAQVELDHTTAASVSLHQLSDALAIIGFNDFVLTDGGAPMIIHSNGTKNSQQPPPVNLNHNVNGAGDTLAGATLAAVTLGKSLDDAVTHHGLPMAASILSGSRLPLDL